MKIIIKKYTAVLMLVSMLISPFSIFAEESIQPLQTNNTQKEVQTSNPEQKTLGLDSPISNENDSDNQEVKPLNESGQNSDLNTQNVEPTVSPERENIISISEVNDETASNETPVIENSNTGNQSENEIENDFEREIEIENNNHAEILNQIDTILNTGENAISDNRGDAVIETGDANLALALLNLINSAFVALPGGEIRFVYRSNDGDYIGDYIIDPTTGQMVNINNGPYLLNTATGNDSNNSIDSNQNNDFVLANSNEGTLNNNLNIYANTGKNKVSDNSGNGIIDTGNINLSLNLLNFLNSTFVVSEKGVFGVINILGDWVGNLLLPRNIVEGNNDQNTQAIFENNNTGNDSENNINLSNNNATDISNNNNASVNNIFQLFANTGGNIVRDNSEGAEIETGSVNNEINIKTFANINVIGDVIYLTFINVLGEWIGKDFVSEFVNSGNNLTTVNNASNTNTGNNSNNSIDSETNNSSSVNNTNNGLLNNYINIFANTGQNKITDNNGSASLKTGNINVLSNIFNLMNVNLYGKKVVLLFVNIFGDWKGNIDFLKENEPKKVIALEDENGQVIEVINDNNDHNIAQTATKKRSNITLNPLNKIPLVANTDDEFTGVRGISDGINNASNDFEVPDEDKSQLVNFVSRNFNYFIFSLIFLYLISLAIYFKGKSEIR